MPRPFCQSNEKSRQSWSSCSEGYLREPTMSWCYVSEWVICEFALFVSLVRMPTLNLLSFLRHGLSHFHHRFVKSRKGANWSLVLNNLQKVNHLSLKTWCARVIPYFAVIFAENRLRFSIILGLCYNFKQDLLSLYLPLAPCETIEDS